MTEKTKNGVQTKTDQERHERFVQQLKEPIPAWVAEDIRQANHDDRELLVVAMETQEKDAETEAERRRRLDEQLERPISPDIAARIDAAHREDAELFHVSVRALYTPTEEIIDEKLN